MSQWHYANGSQKQGPVSSEELAQLARQGTVTPATLVWRDGMANWQPYAQAVPPGDPASTMPAPPTGPDEAVCAVSGKVYPKRDMIQYEGQWISAEHRDEFFQRLREGVAVPAMTGKVPGPYGYGGFWKRFLAKFLDGIIVAIPNQLIGLLIGYLAGQIGLGEVGAMLVALPVTFGIAIGYEVFFIRKYDATPGKMALGLKLLRANGDKLTAGRVVGRYFANLLSALVLYIGYIMAGFDDEKRALHDRICDTRVIRTR